MNNININQTNQIDQMIESQSGDNQPQKKLFRLGIAGLVLYPILIIATILFQYKRMYFVDLLYLGKYIAGNPSRYIMYKILSIQFLIFLFEIYYIVLALKTYKEVRKLNNASKSVRSIKFVNLSGFVIAFFIIQLLVYLFDEITNRSLYLNWDISIYFISFVISISMLVQSKRIKTSMKPINIENENNTLDSKMRKTVRLSIITGVIFIITVIVGIVIEIATYSLRKEFYYSPYEEHTKQLLTQSIPIIVLSIISFVLWMLASGSYKKMNRSLINIGYKGFFSYPKLVLYGSLGYLIIGLISSVILYFQREEAFYSMRFREYKFNNDTYDIISIIMGTYYIFIFVCAILLIISGYNLTRYYGKNTNSNDVQ